MSAEKKKYKFLGHHNFVYSLLQMLSADGALLHITRKHVKMEWKAIMKLLVEIRMGLLRREKQTKPNSQIWAKPNVMFLR